MIHIKFKFINHNKLKTMLFIDVRAQNLRVVINVSFQ